MSYAISGGNQKTIEAAEVILKQGGNAVDAAIAAYLVSFISEPCMASLGASGFAMVNDTKNVKMVDFFCQTPRQKKEQAALDFFPIVVDFGNTTEEFHVGRGSIAVPGAIAGIYKMHEIWGSLPMSEIFEPAIYWSKEGVAIDRFQAYDFQLLKNIFELNEEGRLLFFDRDGTLKKEGDIIKMPQFNDFLTVLKHEGKELFYQGEISRQVSQDLKYDGYLTRADFEQYEVGVYDPLSFDFYGQKVCTTAFPSVGGMTITALLNTFQDATIKEKLSFLSVRHFQKLIDVFRTIHPLNNDPRRISEYLINQFGINAFPRQYTAGRKWGGTSHFNVIDKNGLTVCLTTSLGEGSGYFIPGTDMQMNNMLGEEALMPNGFHNWDTDVRLQSMMSPTIVLDKNGCTQIGIGSGGAGRIPYAISQALINMLYFGVDSRAAVEAPRVHLANKKIEMESGFDLYTELLKHVNIWENQSLFFGGTNIIFNKKNHFAAVADPRRFGATLQG